MKSVLDLKTSASPAPELVALAQERSRWKRAARLLWCAYLILTGQLALVSYEPCLNQPRPEVVPSTYASPVRAPFAVLLTSLRSPPQLA